MLLPQFKHLLLHSNVGPKLYRFEKGHIAFLSKTKTFSKKFKQLYNAHLIVEIKTKLQSCKVAKNIIFVTRYNEKRGTLRRNDSRATPSYAKDLL